MDSCPLDSKIHPFNHYTHDLCPKTVSSGLSYFYSALLQFTQHQNHGVENMSCHEKSLCPCTCYSLSLIIRMVNAPLPSHPTAGVIHFLLHVTRLGHSELEIVLIGQVFATGTKVPPCWNGAWGCLHCNSYHLSCDNLFTCGTPPGTVHSIRVLSRDYECLSLQPPCWQRTPCGISFVRFHISLPLIFHLPSHHPKSVPPDLSCGPSQSPPNSCPGSLLAVPSSSSWWFLLY